MPPSDASAIVTAGLKCAPETGPNVRINATSAAPVAIVLASSAIATLPAASRSPMIPEPTTAASNSKVSTNSATTRRISVGLMRGQFPQAPAGGQAASGSPAAEQGKGLSCGQA